MTLTGHLRDDGRLALPIAGAKICAGFPSPADDFIETLDLARILVANPPATFLWRVEGHSMIGRGIFDGDIVIVDRSLTARHGDVVIAFVDGERSLKVLNLRGEGSRLQCANAAMPPYRVGEESSVEIWGVVTWNLHRFRDLGAR